MMTVIIVATNSKTALDWLLQWTQSIWINHPPKTKLAFCTLEVKSAAAAEETCTKVNLLFNCWRIELLHWLCKNCHVLSNSLEHLSSESLEDLMNMDVKGMILTEFCQCSEATRHCKQCQTQHLSCEHYNIYQAVWRLLHLTVVFNIWHLYSS